LAGPAIAGRSIEFSRILQPAEQHICMKMNLPGMAFVTSLLLINLSCGDRTSTRTGTPTAAPTDSPTGAPPTTATTASTGPATAITPPPAESSRLRHAQGFSIIYAAGYKELKIPVRSSRGTDTLDYLLLHSGAPVPPGHTHAQVIRIPVQTFVVMGSTHIAQADFAGVADRITGVGDGRYVYSPSVREGIKTGRIRLVGTETNLNDELVISMRPGVLMTTTDPDAGFARYTTLIKAGIPVLPNAEWLETTPLGKAEWVKLFGALTDREALVDKKFDNVEQQYERLAAIGRAATPKPSVIIGMPFNGTWYTPAGGSYVAAFLRDAGAAYHWMDTNGTGSLGLSFEAMAPQALKADVWLNPGLADSKKDILSQDPRYSSFPALQTGAVFNNTKRVEEDGPNDYWESGAVNPQGVLADLIRILHPDALPADTLIYYKQLK
jgi:iron complex transport system substrate-binding protein